MTRRGTTALAAVLMLAVSGGCSSAPLAAPEPRAAVTTSLPDPSVRDVPPEGEVVVAYPDEPSTFLGPVGREPAVDDLAALWGLPLFRLDDAGQLRRGLVEDFEVLGDGADGWQVRLNLREGSWSDGSAVDAPDVVATLQARKQEAPEHFGLLTAVAADGDDVVVTFDGPVASWPSLLIEAGTMLPSEVVAGQVDYDRSVPVSGGWFRLAEYEPGLHLEFEAHPDGPLGPPGLARLEVLFVPGYETALGLLDRGDVDVVLGHLPINGVARATELDGVTAAAPLGGTTVSLEFRDEGALGGVELAERRRGVAETLDVGELVEGMLGPAGAVAQTVWPQVDFGADPPVGELREGLHLELLVPGGGEVTGFTARALERDLVSRGMTMDVVSEPAPRFARILGVERDVALTIRRTPPRPSLSRFTSEVDPARAGDAAALGEPAVMAGLAAVAAEARVVPLYRVGVLHAWKGVDGVRPSSWVGAGFANAGDWVVPS